MSHSRAHREYRGKPNCLVTESINLKFNNHTDLKSRHAYILLVSKLHQKDIDTFKAKKWLKNKKRLLRMLLVYNDTLHCEYCGRENLVAGKADGKNTRCDILTLDHYIPVSNGGSMYNEKNLIVCCNKCNQKLSDQLNKVLLFELKRNALT